MLTDFALGQDQTSYLAGWHKKNSGTKDEATEYWVRRLSAEGDAQTDITFEALVSNDPEPGIAVDGESNIYLMGSESEVRGLPSFSMLRVMDSTGELLCTWHEAAAISGRGLTIDRDGALLSAGVGRPTGEMWVGKFDRKAD